MLFPIVIVTALIALVGIPWLRMLAGASSANLGAMSPHWVAEHRASNGI